MSVRLLAVTYLFMLSFAAKAQVKTSADRLRPDSAAYQSVPSGLNWHEIKPLRLRALKPIQNFRTWNIGINTGILSPFLVIGGANNFTNVALKQGFDISVRKQLIHQLGFQFDALTGHVSGTNPPLYKGNASTVQSFNTNLAYSLALTGLLQMGSLDIFQHHNALNFFVLAGAGFIGYAPSVIYADGSKVNYEGHVGFTREKNFVHELTTQAGIGLKYRINNRLTFNGGYTANFVDDDFFDGTYGNTFNTSLASPASATDFARGSRKNKFSYGYFGLEVSAGKTSKPNIDWLSGMPEVYERLADSARMDSTLRLRMLSFQHKLDSLKADEDGDGVPDYFDKCPHTPKATPVDGSGCPIIMPNGGPDSSLLAKINRLDTLPARATEYPVVIFDYNSAIIPNPYYQQLDAVAKDLRDHPAKKVFIHGYASSEGQVAHNISLSVARASAVKAYLISNGVAAGQITTKGYGETHPRANNATEQGRILNRRATFE